MEGKAGHLGFQALCCVGSLADKWVRPFLSSSKVMTVIANSTCENCVILEITDSRCVNASAQFNSLILPSSTSSPVINSPSPILSCFNVDSRGSPCLSLVVFLVIYSPFGTSSAFSTSRLSILILPPQPHIPRLPSLTFPQPPQPHIPPASPASHSQPPQPHIPPPPQPHIPPPPQPHIPSLPSLTFPRLPSLTFPASPASHSPADTKYLSTATPYSSLPTSKLVSPLQLLTRHRKSLKDTTDGDKTRQAASVYLQGTTKDMKQ
ncbi:proline-rich receptor-like protein kinase PERK2 [Portunus trituberculatus]|uniref:proline-rich receptor-like protein kinase PERK2 n=1 Tax=Portunus trituberculatus TaxID=210409 RepID=UPI001E1D0726|nr:proline-rich receptor-like protein kinase PERK2 [Portunus trituberculatus]